MNEVRAQHHCIHLVQLGNALHSENAKHSLNGTYAELATDLLCGS